MAYDADGVLANVGAGVDVAVSFNGVDCAESPLTTNSDGEIVAGSIAARSAGDKLDFRVENYNGLAGSKSELGT